MEQCICPNEDKVNTVVSISSPVGGVTSYGGCSLEQCLNEEKINNSFNFLSGGGVDNWTFFGARSLEQSLNKEKVNNSFNFLSGGGVDIQRFPQFRNLKVHKIENFFDCDFGICVISLLVMSKY